LRNAAEGAAYRLLSSFRLQLDGRDGRQWDGGQFDVFRFGTQLQGHTRRAAPLLREAARSAVEESLAIREKLGTTWGLSETGASGPTGNRYGDSAGHACLAVAGPVERAITVETRAGDREANMWIFARAALDLLTACVKEAR
jgi:hypothetical protein